MRGDPRKAARARRPAVVPQQAALRRSGRLRPAPQPRAGRASGTRSRCSPASPTPSSTTGVRLTKVPASTSTASPTRSGRRGRCEFRDLDRRRGGPDHVDGRVPRAEDLQPRVARLLRERAGDFDVVHDNQVLGYGMLELRGATASRWSRPSTTRSPSTAGSTSQTAPTWRKRLTLRRWYGFLRMQAQGRPQATARCSRRRSPRAATSSRDFGVDPARMQVDPARRRRRLRAADQPRGCPAGSSRWPAPTRR